jgi:hypothetical protein
MIEGRKNETGMRPVTATSRRVETPVPIPFHMPALAAEVIAVQREIILILPYHVVIGAAGRR